MPWILYLHFSNDCSLDASLSSALKLSQNIEREENGYWLDLRGPQTVFEVMGELKSGAGKMALAPHKWLAKALALMPDFYPARTVIGDCWYLLHNRKKSDGQVFDVLWFSPSAAARDFYPSAASVRQAWQEWGASACWHEVPLERVWFLEKQVIGKLQKLGFTCLGQLLPLGEDFLSRETGNPYFTAYLRGEKPPGLQTNYPENMLQAGQELRDPENFREAGFAQMEAVLKQLVESLVNQLAQRRMGCLKLELEVSHAGERVVRERVFSSPQYTWSGLYENAYLLVSRLQFPAYEELRLSLHGLQTIVYPQFSLFEQGVRHVPRELSMVTARYPRVLQQGMKFSRREQMLVYWDPWRGKRGEGD